MVVGRAVGILLILIAAGILGHELLKYAETGSYHLIALGEFWYLVHRGSLNMFQAGVQRHIAPWLWDDVITRILLAPAWAVFGGLGLVIWLLFRHRRRRPLDRRLG